MFFESDKLNQKFEKILKEKFRFSDEMIADLTSKYISNVVTTLMTTTAAYIEEKNLKEELGILDKLTKISDDITNIKTAKKQVNFLVSIYLKYPDLKKKVDDKVNEIRNGYIEDFFKEIDEKIAIDFFTTVKEVAEETASLAKYIEEYKQTLKSQSSQELQAPQKVN